MQAGINHEKPPYCLSAVCLPGCFQCWIHALSAQTLDSCGGAKALPVAASCSSIQICRKPPTICHLRARSETMESWNFGRWAGDGVNLLQLKDTADFQKIDMKEAGILLPLAGEQLFDSPFTGLEKQIYYSTNYIHEIQYVIHVYPQSDSRKPAPNPSFQTFSIFRTSMRTSVTT